MFHLCLALASSLSHSGIWKLEVNYFVIADRTLQWHPQMSQFIDYNPFQKRSVSINGQFLLSQPKTITSISQ